MVTMLNILYGNEDQKVFLLLQRINFYRGYYGV